MARLFTRPTPGAPRRALSEARPKRVKPRGVALPYVEGLNDARTKLADFSAPCRGQISMQESA